MGNRAVVYCRISADKDEREVGVVTQEKDCRALAARRGWDVVDVFVDNNRSAWKRNRKRPGWDQLMAGLADKAYDIVIVWHGDRLMRQPRDLEDLIDIADRGVQLASPGGERDLSNPDDLFILRIETAHACRSSDDTSRRVKRAHLRLAQEGKDPGGGSRPFGYRDDRVSIDPHESALIREAASRTLAGDTVRSICADWNARGVPTVSGRPWTTFVFKRMLTSARIAGWRSHNGAFIAPAQWPAILDRATVERLRGLLLDPARRVNHNPRRYLLTGLARCGLCGGKLIARPRDDKRRTYVCSSGPNFSGCGRIRILADPLEEWVTELVLIRLDSPALTEQLAGEHDVDQAPLMVEIEACEAKLADLAGQWASDELTRPEWIAARKAVEARLSAARRQLLEADRPRPVAGMAGQGSALRSSWPTLEFARRRGVVTAVVDQVVVGPAVKGRNFFDRARVDVRWAV